MSLLPALPAIPVLLLQYGYLSIFLGIAIGGEILLLAVGFLSSLGYFNIFLAVLVATTSVIATDTLWYLVGRAGRKNFIEKYGKYIFVTPKRLRKAETFFKKHDAKAMLLVRFVYGFRAITLITAGISRMKYGRFFIYNFIGTLIWSATLGALGYFFGESWVILKDYIENLTIVISITAFMVVIGLIIISIVKKRLMKKYQLNGNSDKKTS